MPDVEMTTTDDHIAVVTLNRPERRNALSSEHPRRAAPDLRRDRVRPRNPCGRDHRCRGGLLRRRRHEGGTG